MGAARIALAAATVVVTAGVAAGVYVGSSCAGVIGGLCGGGVVANEWVNTSAGASPTRCSPACGYNSATAYGSVAAAIAAASNNDIVFVQCSGSSYGAQAIAVNAGLTSGSVVVKPLSNLCATLGAVTIATGAGFFALDNFNINALSPVSDGTSGSSASSTHVTLTGDYVDVGQPTQGPLINLHAPDTPTITNNVFGPACCGNNGGGTANASTECIRIGKTSTEPNATNVTITGNLCQFVERDATLWPSSGWGSAPQATCTDFTVCHADGFHIWGCVTCNISGNRLYGDDCQGIFLEPTNGSLNSNVTIVNNAISDLAEPGCSNKSIYVNANGANTTDGTWTIAFNSGSGLLDLGNGFAGCAATSCTFNMTGNNMTLFVTDGSGNNAGCNGGSPTNVTLNYNYNVWHAGGTNTACGANDILSSPGWRSSVAAPAVGQDMSLSGSDDSTTADQFVPAATGAPITTVDFLGQARPFDAGHNFDAGANER